MSGSPLVKKLFLSSPSFAVVGASKDQTKFGTKVLKWYQARDLDVKPVHPKEPELEGLKTVQKLSELSNPSKTSVSIITNPKITLNLLQEAKDLDVPALWLQPGAEDDSVVEFIKENGLEDKTNLEPNLFHRLPLSTSIVLGGVLVTFTVFLAIEWIFYYYVFPDRSGSTSVAIDLDTQSQTESQTQAPSSLSPVLLPFHRRLFHRLRTILQREHLPNQEVIPLPSFPLPPPNTPASFWDSSSRVIPSPPFNTPDSSSSDSCSYHSDSSSHSHSHNPVDSLFTVRIPTPPITPPPASKARTPRALPPIPPVPMSSPPEPPISRPDTGMTQSRSVSSSSSGQLTTPLRALLRTGTAEDLLYDLPGLDGNEMYSLARQALPEFGTPSKVYTPLRGTTGVNLLSPVTPTTRAVHRLTPVLESGAEEDNYLHIAPISYESARNGDNSTAAGSSSPPEVHAGEDDILRRHRTLEEQRAQEVEHRKSAYPTVKSWDNIVVIPDVTGDSREVFEGAGTCIHAHHKLCDMRPRKDGGLLVEELRKIAQGLQQDSTGNREDLCIRIKDFSKHTAEEWWTMLNMPHRSHKGPRTIPPKGQQRTNSATTSKKATSKKAAARQRIATKAAERNSAIQMSKPQRGSGDIRTPMQIDAAFKKALAIAHDCKDDFTPEIPLNHRFLPPAQNLTTLMNTFATLLEEVNAKGHKTDHALANKSNSSSDATTLNNASTLEDGHTFNGADDHAYNDDNTVFEDNHTSNDDAALNDDHTFNSTSTVDDRTVNNNASIVNEGLFLLEEPAPGLSSGKRPSDALLEYTRPKKKTRRSRAITTATICIGRGKSIIINRKDAPSWPRSGMHVVTPIRTLVQTWDRSSDDWNPQPEYCDMMSVAIEGGERQVIGLKDLPQLYRHKASDDDRVNGDDTKEGPGWTTVHRNQWLSWNHFMTYYLSIGKDAFEKKHGSIDGGAQFSVIDAYLRKQRQGDLLEVDALKVLWGSQYDTLFKVVGKDKIISDKIAANKRHQKCLDDGHRYDSAM